jgi:hypothetical protein
MSANDPQWTLHPIQAFQNFFECQNAIIQTHASEREWRLSDGTLSRKRKAKDGDQ